MKIAIEPKLKSCKGINKAKGWPGCGIQVYNRTYGLCNKCYSKWLLLTDEGREKVRRATLKATKPQRELQEAEKERKERKGLPRALELTQKAFNAYIRERDKYRPCISSGIPWKDDFDAGHLFSVKQYSALRFDEDNCHGQSIQENRFNEGNFENYLLNVKERIGPERLDKLLKKAEKSKAECKKWSLDELAEIRKYYRQKLKEL